MSTIEVSTYSNQAVSTFQSKELTPVFSSKENAIFVDDDDVKVLVSEANIYSMSALF